jgi:hypothetical protein
VGAVAQEDPAVELDPPLLDLLHLVEELDEIDDDSVGDHADALVEDAGGDQVEDVLLAVHDHRVAGVPAALEADDEIGLLGQDVDDLALPLVAPLDADDAAGGVQFAHLGYLLASMFLRNCWNR